MSNILTWGNGFISSHLPYDKIQERATIDPDNIRSILKVYKPDVLINGIGYCGVKNIDDCDLNKEKTFVANTILPSIIANECDKLGIHFIHIGSGCIFSGHSPNTIYDGIGMLSWTSDLGWKETDTAGPVSYYSNTKLACDLLISSLPNVAILRIRMPISSSNSPRNFISKIKGYDKIIDIPNSVTFTDDLVRSIEWVIKHRKNGIYNVVNPGALTAVDVMREYQKYKQHQFDIITGEQLDRLTTAKRSNCILDGSKLAKEGFIMTPSKVALEKTMAEYINNMETDVK